MKILKALISETLNLSWTLAGTGLVLITISGRTLQLGWYISIGGFLCHMLGVLFELLTNEQETND